VSSSVARLPSTIPPLDAVPAIRHPNAPLPGELIPSHFAQCFGCGQDHPTGLRLIATAGVGASVTATFTVTEHHQGAPGLAHGGILSLAFDETLSSLMWLLRRPAVTARLETDFLRPVPIGSTLSLTAEVTGVSNRKVYSKAEGRIGDGPPVVRAQALFVIVPMTHFLNAGSQEHLDYVRANPHLHASVDPDFEVNP
jgi:acyl-coenzyme A thioesterase PaaI-like protein